MSGNAYPTVRAGSKLALRVDESGCTVYANKAGLISLADRLLRIAMANPDECFECHTRSELGGVFEGADRSDVVLILDKEIGNYFSRLPLDAPVDAHPVGFELTFMHVNEPALDELKRIAEERS